MKIEGICVAIFAGCTTILATLVGIRYAAYIKCRDLLTPLLRKDLNTLDNTELPVLHVASTKVDDLVADILRLMFFWKRRRFKTE